MRVIKPHLYAAVIAGAPLAELAGSISGYPTHATLLWRAVTLAAAILLLPLSWHFLRRLAGALVIPILYVATFILVSWWGVAWNESVTNRVLWLPLILMDFACWYALAWYVNARVFLYLAAVSACIFGIGSLIAAQSGLIDPERSRVIYGADIPMAIPGAVMVGSPAMTIVLLLVSLASLKKTVLGCSVAAAGWAWMGKKLNRNPWRSPIRVAGVPPEIKLPLAILVSGAALLMLGVEFAPYISDTLDRVSGDGEDVTRLAMVEEFVRLIGEWWPQGTGYYTFPFMTFDTISSVQEDLYGNEVVGLPLHNTYMHYALEGGLAIVVLIALLHVQYIHAILKLRKIPGQRPLAHILIAWLIVSVIFGMFQQWQAHRYFFGMFGFAIGALHHISQRTRVRYDHPTRATGLRLRESQDSRPD